MAEPEKGIAISERRRHGLDRWILFVFLVAGSASVVVLKTSPVPVAVRIAVPVAIIALYALLTVFRTRFRIRYDQAGDNCYYMGFIFTLVSLGVALYHVRADISVQAYGIGVVRDFGLALSTTVVGIILRVALNQIREDPHDIEEASRRELIEHSRALSGQLRASVALMIDVREATEDRLKTMVYETRQLVGEHQDRIEELKTASGVLVAKIKELADDLGATEIPTGRLRSAAAETIDVVRALSNAIRTAETDVKRLGPAATEAAAGYEKMSGAVSAVAEQGTRLSASMADSAAKSSDLSRGLGSLSAEIGSIAKSRDGFAAVAENLKALTEALRSASRSIGSTNSRLGAAEQSLANQLALAERAASELAGQLAALRTAQVDASGQALSATPRAAE